MGSHYCTSSHSLATASVPRQRLAEPELVDVGRLGAIQAFFHTFEASVLTEIKT